MPRYQIIDIERPVGSGVTDAQWASVGAVIKRNSAKDPYCVPNELVCATLGQFLGLPIPPCGLFADPRDPSKPSFGTLNFNLSRDVLPPAPASQCVAAYSDATLGRPDVVTGVLIFDVWVANGDRHKWNLNLDRSQPSAQLHVFDHSHALFGQEGPARLYRLRNELAIAGLDPLSGNRHCLLDAVKSNVRFRFWLDRIQQVPDFVITDALDIVFRAGLIDGAEITAARSFLQYRRANLSDIITKWRAEFTGIPTADWRPL